eukprot:3086140-Prymnesium_polylepis.1
MRLWPRGKAWPLLAVLVLSRIPSGDAESASTEQAAHGRLPPPPSPRPPPHDESYNEDSYGVAQIVSNK